MAKTFKPFALEVKTVEEAVMLGMQLKTVVNDTVGWGEVEGVHQNALTNADDDLLERFIELSHDPFDIELSGYIKEHRPDPATLTLEERVAALEAKIGG